MRAILRSRLFVSVCVRKSLSFNSNNDDFLFIPTYSPDKNNLHI